MTFSSPRFSPWQQAALDTAKEGGTIGNVIAKIRARYPRYTLMQAWNAAEDAIDKLEHKNILRCTDGTLRLVTTEQPNESTAP